MDIYDLMLEELEKGNALYVEVEPDELRHEYRSRFRLVTPKRCEYDYVDAPDAVFTKSCFVGCVKRKDSKSIIDVMRKYDLRHGLHVSTFTAL